jgi:hypothetical protein
LKENAALPGPCKFIRRPEGTVVCRADLPRAVLGGEEIPDDEAGSNPAAVWVAALTAMLGGEPVTAPALVAPPAEIAALLEANGWVVAAADGVVRISIALPGLFRQTVLDTRSPGATRCWCELVDLKDWPDVCRTAALALAGAANDRLVLTRFALERRAEAEPLFAEINLASLPVPGAWLDVALEAMHTAIALTARELSALRDPELAQWALTASAV